MKVPAGARQMSLQHVVRDAQGNVLADLGTVAYWHKNPLRRFWWTWVGKPAADERIRRFNKSQEGK